MIQADKVTKRYNKSAVLNALSLEIPDGSIFGLVGVNGAGKSTLMRLICGVLRADSGTITVDGEDISKNPAAKGKLAFVPDEPYFIKNADLSRMARLYKAVYPAFSKARLFELALALNIDCSKKIDSFSKGLKRQAAIILAMSAYPKYLIMDETFDGLDPAVRAAVRRILFEDAALRKMSVIMTSHSLRELEDTCDRLALLHGGKIAFDGDIQNIRTSLIKIQTAFDGDFSREIFDGIEILSLKKYGRVYELIARGDKERITEAVRIKNPLFLELMPLSLEEIFIHETAALGYSFDEVRTDETK